MRPVGQIQVLDANGRVRLIEKLSVDIKIRTVDSAERWEPTGSYRFSLDGVSITPHLAEAGVIVLATGEHFKIVSGSLD